MGTGLTCVNDVIYLFNYVTTLIINKFTFTQLTFIKINIQ